MPWIERNLLSSSPLRNAVPVRVFRFFFCFFLASMSEQDDGWTGGQERGAPMFSYLHMWCLHLVHVVFSGHSALWICGTVARSPLPVHRLPRGACLVR